MTLEISALSEPAGPIPSAQAPLLSHDERAYAKYSTWCQSIGLPASSSEVWCKVSNKIEGGYKKLRHEIMRPEDCSRDVTTKKQREENFLAHRWG